MSRGSNSWRFIDNSVATFPADLSFAGSLLDAFFLCVSSTWSSPCANLKVRVKEKQQPLPGALSSTSSPSIASTSRLEMKRPSPVPAVAASFPVLMIHAYTLRSKGREGKKQSSQIQENNRRTTAYVRKPELALFAL
jgi:hypothetical protein